MHRNDFFFPPLCLLKVSDSALDGGASEKGIEVEHGKRWEGERTRVHSDGQRSALRPKGRTVRVRQMGTLEYVFSCGSHTLSLRQLKSFANRLVFPDQQTVEEAEAVLYAY